MFTRATGIVIIPVWLVAIGWIVQHDVLPGWTAQEPPTLQVTEWLRNQGTKSEFAILNDGVRLGTIWTTYRMSKLALPVGEGDRDAALPMLASIQREDLIWIAGLPPMSMALNLAPLRMRVDSVFTPAGELDEFTLRVQNAMGDLRLHGERFHADFSFTLDTGAAIRNFKLPLQDGSILAGALNPFTRLSGIHVGQRWRMQVFNPIAALTGLGAGGPASRRFTTMLVEVTGRESILVGEKVVDCFVVETARASAADRAKAWVDERGAVQVQETTLPLVGRLRIVRQATFDEETRRFVRNRPVPRMADPRSGGFHP